LSGREFLDEDIGLQKKMINTIFLTIDFPPMGGGMSRHSHDVSMALRRMGADCVVIAPAAERKKGAMMITV